MKRKIGFILVAALLILGAFSLTACGNKKADETVYQIRNGGFETGDLTGWTVESGNAFSDDCVTTKSDFGFADDGYTARIAMGQTGKWHLYGKAFDDSYESQRVGAIRSETFTLGGDGTVSLKLAGGSVYYDDGTEKPLEKQCYVGIYLEDGRMISRITNRYFVKHSGNYDPNKYADIDEFTPHTLSTDNYNNYSVNLKEHIGEKMYIRIVDEDPDFYYGYLSVDDIRTLSSASAQDEGEYFAKIRTYDDIELPANDVANGGFETGSIAGWTVTEGDAFSHLGVNASPTWWRENIPYNRDGEYHYGFYNPTATGRMRSNVFTLSGSGYVSYKLGGCADRSRAYVRIMAQIKGEEVELARVSNSKFRDIQFPYVSNGLKLANMVQYYIDLSGYLGEKIFFEVVDENADTNENACVVLDSVKAYYEERPVFDGEAFEVKVDLFVPDIEPVNEYQVKNGTFETGDLTGWTVGNTGDMFEPWTVVNEDGWWNENLSYNRRGKYNFSTLGTSADNWLKAGVTGSMRSETFTVGGSGFMTYLMGGRGGYIALWKEVEDGDDVLLEKFYNHGFMIDDPGSITPEKFNITAFLCNMVEYKADISEYLGERVYLEIVDDNHHSEEFLNVTLVDSIITYHEEEPAGAYRPAYVNGDLKALIATAKAIEIGDYTQASFDALRAKITAAEAVANNGQSHVNEVNAAKDALQSAIDALTLKVPEKVNGANTALSVRKGGSRAVTISDYVNENGLNGITYSLTVSGDGLSADTTAPTANFTVSASNTAQSGTATLTVIYKKETAFTVEFTVTVTDGTFTVPNEAPELDVDLFTLKEGNKTDIVASEYVRIAEQGITLTYSVTGTNGCSATVDGTKITVAKANASAGNATVTVKVTDAANGLEKEFTLTLKYYDSTPYRLENGGFETGDLTGWATTGDAFEDFMVRGSATDANVDSSIFNAERLYGRVGKFNFTSFEHGAQGNLENRTGTMTSSTFTVGGTGWITFLMGGGANMNEVYISVYLADSNTEIARYGNRFFKSPYKVGNNTYGREGEFTPYAADLSEHIGKRVYIKVTDNATAGWALVTLDEFVTYYATQNDLPNIVNDVDLIANPTREQYMSQYRIAQNIKP